MELGDIIETCVYISFVGAIPVGMATSEYLEAYQHYSKLDPSMQKELGKPSYVEFLYSATKRFPQITASFFIKSIEIKSSEPLQKYRSAIDQVRK